jgi:hypothetical protein
MEGTATVVLHVVCYIVTMRLRALLDGYQTALCKLLDRYQMSPCRRDYTAAHPKDSILLTFTHMTTKSIWKKTCSICISVETPFCYEKNRI